MTTKRAQVAIHKNIPPFLIAPCFPLIESGSSRISEQDLLPSGFMLAAGGFLRIGDSMLL
jgi:hypothetical protein